MYTPEELAVMKANARQARLTPSAYRRYMTTGIEPEQKLPSEKEIALLQGIAALQQLSKKFEQTTVSDDILNELIAIRQLIAKGLSK